MLANVEKEKPELYPVFVTEVRAIYRRTVAKTALDAARMVGRLAACAGP